MFDMKNIEALSERIVGLLPEDGRVLQEEFKHNLRPLLESMLARMDLVTRDEFDAQTRVLNRTRAKLELIERELDRLESAPPGA
ncbi:MAG: accessory factor UbiK family protein [Gammaproteobacteria bacterium]